METIVVTGANRGIGYELTKLYLKAGYNVVATCRQPDVALELQSLAQNKNLNVLKLEVTDNESVLNFSSQLAGQVVDVLINNAGIMGGDHQNIDNMDYDAWLQTLKVNTLAPFHIAIELRNNLLKSKRPRIITLSSQMGSLSRESTGSYAYRSSKAALNKVMQVLSLDLKPDGIIVCPVHPGWVQTDMGGPNADITVQESASGLFRLIDSLTIEQTGKFWTWQGSEHPW